MTREEAKTFNVGDPVAPKSYGFYDPHMNHLITEIEEVKYTTKKGLHRTKLVFTLDNGKRIDHMDVNPPILASNLPFRCSWFKKPVKNIDEAMLPNGKTYTQSRDEYWANYAKQRRKP